VTNKRFPPLVIRVYGDQANEFIRHQPTLSEQGYTLEAYQDLTQLVQRSDSTDVSIVNLAALNIADRDTLIEQSKPFLIYDFNDNLLLNVDDDFVHKAVGCFVDRPSSKDISLKVELGLLLHEERRDVNKRLININQKFETNRDIGVAIGLVMVYGDLSTQQAFEFLRTIARNKRCRVSDISSALIEKQTAQKHGSQKHSKDLSSIKQWLEDEVSINHERD